MANLPLRVRGRDNTGAVAEVLCDDAKSALANAKHFRDAGYADVWIEDVDGRMVAEGTLNA